jgi:hypothetical protein
MIKVWVAGCVLVCAVAALFAAVAVRGAATGKTVAVSILRFPIAPGERVVGFEFRLTSARIAAVPHVPSGWDVHVENNPSWNTGIKASALVGAAALDAAYFRNFLQVEKNESLELPFKMTGEIVVTRDFVSERHIAISMRDVTVASATNQRTTQRWLLSPALFNRHNN